MALAVEENVAAKTRLRRVARTGLASDEDRSERRGRRCGMPYRSTWLQDNHQSPPFVPGGSNIAHGSRGRKAFGSRGPDRVPRLARVAPGPQAFVASKTFRAMLPAVIAEGQPA